MNRFYKGILFTLLFGLIFHPLPVLSEMTPKEIISKADEARGNLEGVEWELKIESVESGRKQERTLRIKSRAFKTLAEFISPPKVKGQKLLMIDRNMWFISKGVKKPLPISPRQKLIGGASNGDIASTNFAGDYEAALISEECINGEPCYLFELVASNKKVVYDKIHYWISKERFVGIKSDFFSVSGKLLKSATMEYKSNILKNDKDRLFISKMIITDSLIKNDITTMTYSKIEIKHIPESNFNLNLLLR